jgi:hypothetical protein
VQQREQQQFRLLRFLVNGGQLKQRVGVRDTELVGDGRGRR